MEFAVINCSIPPFDNELVRQAMSFAIDRREVLQGAIQEIGRLTGPLPEVMNNWALPTDQFATYTRDVEKAKALLVQAGMPDGFRTTMTVIPTFPTLVASAQIIADQVRDVGIAIEIEQVEYGIFLERLGVVRDMPLAMSLTQGFGDPDAYLFGRFHSKGFNLQNWNEPEVDALLEQGRAAADPAERKAIYDELQRLLADVKVPYLWLYSPDLIDVSQTRVQGYVQHPTSFLYGMEQVWLQD
jgi:peptide/nickel transport system substrate-binding protein